MARYPHGYLAFELHVITYIISDTCRINLIKGDLL